MEQYNNFSCTKYNSKNCNNCKFKQFKHFKLAENHDHLPKQKKAGIVYYNRTSHKILIVQSRGNLWGIPKGTCKYNENINDCAVREFFEETGIDIKSIELENCKTVVIGTCTYYCLESDFEYDFDNFTHSNFNKIENNDVSGIGCVDINCLIKSNLKLNLHLRKILERFYLLFKK